MSVQWARRIPSSSTVQQLQLIQVGRHGSSSRGPLPRQPGGPARGATAAVQVVTVVLVARLSGPPGGFLPYFLDGFRVGYAAVFDFFADRVGRASPGLSLGFLLHRGRRDRPSVQCASDAGNVRVGICDRFRCSIMLLKLLVLSSNFISKSRYHYFSLFFSNNDK